MTVLSFADTRFPIERANGLQTMATCQALAAAGHDVTLVVRPDASALARDPFAFYGLPPAPRLAIETIPSAGSARRRRLRFLLGALARVRARPGAIVYTRDLGLAAFLLQLPRAGRPRVVYESHGVASVVGGELPRLLGKPELAPSAAKCHRLDRRDRRVWMRAGAYVTITRALADDLSARFGARSRVFVVPDGASAPAASGVETMAPIASAANGGGARGDGSIVAGYAGHLYPWKGVDIFVRALARAPRVRGLIVGGHPGERDRDRVTALIADLHLADRVEVTGLVPPGAVAAALARADILVLPNTLSVISERYTSPLKLFEYLWTGKPIVASDFASIREVLTDGKTALLVPPDDPDALAAAFARLAADRALAEVLGQRARHLAPEYTWAKRAARLTQALEAARA